MGTEKRYWTGMEELHETEEFVKSRDNEFTAELPVEEFLAQTGAESMTSGRRDFLKFLGFSVGAATLAACETPVTRVIPYVNKPEEITPGIATYYASAYYDGYDFASILVKTREGRPIHIKGNKDSAFGAVNSRINSSVLSLYDSTRLQGPVANDGTSISWATADERVRKALSEANSSGGEIAFLTESVNSPSTLRAIDRLKLAYPSAKLTHTQYDARSFEGMRQVYGVIPFFDFDQAKVIVGVGADFMNDFPLSAQYTAAYGRRRKPEGTWMSEHHHFEAQMSLTGSNADYRMAIKPSDEGKVLASIYNHVTGRGSSNDFSEATAKAAAALKGARGQAMVLSGSNDPDVQMIAKSINDALGSIGKAVNTARPVRMSNGNLADFKGLMSRMSTGGVKVLFMNGVNPSYSVGEGFNAALSKVDFSVSFALHADETASRCSMILPGNHALESWNDYNVVGNTYSLAQPTIRPLYDTRQYQDGILNWAGYGGSYYDFMQEAWTQEHAARSNASGMAFWNQAVHDGGAELSATRRGSTISDSPDTDEGDARNIVERVLGLNRPEDEAVEAAEEVVNIARGSASRSTYSGDINSALSAVAGASASGTELFLYTKTGIGTGEHATNPWLQELPDPMTKICWDNYITMSPVDVVEGGYNHLLGQELPASLATVEANGKSLTLPVVPMPGQKSGTIGIALGYGRGAGNENIGKAAYRTKEYGGYEMSDADTRIPIGGNAYVFVSDSNATCGYHSAASVSPTGEDFPIASTQTQHTVMERHSVVKETSLGIFKTADSDVYNPPHTLPVHEGGKTVQKPVSEIDLWDQHPIEEIGHWWGLNIDLTTCTGCSACVTACHSENNVPVVGKDEVRRSRDMHWMRIDRYFSSDMTKAKAAEEGLGKIDMYADMEIPAENPSVVHMPMMCQHCNHAPCETVCPVAATTHSSEGLNQMTYNRCIGTRYCANNCPYKVRRFNWFNYKAYAKFTEVNPSQDWMGRLVLNPDVTVRSRGVMEKCSMCVQRIQAGKLDAKMAGTPVPDGAISTACSEACPTNAITFGDMNDKASKVASQLEDKRTYLALEEVGTRPSVSYQVKVRNNELNEG